jgi:hypothetical protein
MARLSYLKSGKIVVEEGPKEGPGSQKGKVIGE